MASETKSFAIVFALALVLLAILINPGASKEEKGTLPSVILQGFEAYKTDGAEAVVKAWLKGSSLEGSKEAMSQASGLKQIETFYGNYVAYHMLHKDTIAPNCQMYYFSIDFEKGPGFCKILTFKSTKGEIIVNFKFHTDPERILPSSLLSE